VVGGGFRRWGKWGVKSYAQTIDRLKRRLGVPPAAAQMEGIGKKDKVRWGLRKKDGGDYILKGVTAEKEGRI